MASFFYCGRLSSAQLVPLQAPKHRPIISPRPFEQTMDYKTVFINLCLELPQNLSWIKGLGKNPFTHSIPFTHSLTAVPFVRGHWSVFPRNTGVYTRHPACIHVIQRLSQPRVACWHGFRPIHGLRSEGVKSLPSSVVLNLMGGMFIILIFGYFCRDSKASKSNTKHKGKKKKGNDKGKGKKKK